MDISPESLRGHFLMAMPSLMDANFHKSVTCISEHNDQGAVGIVVNQIHEGITAGLIFEELGIAFKESVGALSIHIGGPVHMNELFVLHGPPLSWNGSLIFGNDLAMSNAREIIEAIALDQGPRNFIIALGCAGWAPGQLEWEMSQNAWLVTPCRNDIMFELPIETRWESAIRLLGIDPQRISDSAGHA
ncbi:MAG: hypothetical protein HKP58_06635 [Desulfatitalea sp.]|nr:YqgE/AlgH family protein [Desulfatitalea sp.]NNK00074.1 hypothetical protein [Desulfatitalea sp.]